ncbi:MAG: hypothetical protein NTZ05_22385 [Chloroflexi bacterium]|nr:hypothetical protein [Chloroflexota bacterium]
MEREMFGLPKLELPPPPPLTPEELERRRKWFDELVALSEKIGPVNATLQELMDDDGEDEDG